jgi:hypothetical protein
VGIRSALVSCSRRLAPTLAGVAGLVLAAAPARALDVTITYQFNADLSGSFPVSTILAGQRITGLTAKLVAPLPTLNASTLTGAPSLLSLVLSNQNGTFAFPGIPALADVSGGSLASWLRTGAIALGHGQGISVYANQHLTTRARIDLAQGTLDFLARQQFVNDSTASTVLFFLLTTQVRGVEVSRTAVPEPGTANLVLGGGILALGAWQARRAWRRRGVQAR